MKVPINFTTITILSIVLVTYHIQTTIAVDPIADSTVTFRIQAENGEIHNSTFERDDLKEHGCDPNGLVAFVVHGWLEGCDTEWVNDTITNLTFYRGGCIVCMDYSRHSKNFDYFFNLVPKFDLLSDILTRKLEQFERQGFLMENVFMFGFSFGGQLAVQAAAQLGEQLIGEIDTCDMAGPGFDSRNDLPDPKLAAKNVQCIHTSSDKGTHRRNCHQDFMMGTCGLSQLAAGSFPKGSHGLCPYIYNSAFAHEFLAVKNPQLCSTKREAATWPLDFRMGYLERRKNQVFGDLFALTSAAYPYVDNTYALPRIVPGTDSELEFYWQNSTESTTILETETDLTTSDPSATILPLFYNDSSNAIF